MERRESLRPMRDDAVFVLRVMLEPVFGFMGPRNIAIDGRLGGPYWSDLDLGDVRYRVTIERVDDDAALDPPFVGATS
jgi:hypothetical protein